jgi:hypothetical protein
MTMTEREESDNLHLRRRIPSPPIDNSQIIHLLPALINLNIQLDIPFQLRPQLHFPRFLPPHSNRMIDLREFDQYVACCN